MTRRDVTRQNQYVKAIAALLANTTLQAAADDVGVSLRTLQRWMQEDDFIAMLHEAQDALLSQAALRVVGLSSSAINTLRDVLADADAPLGVKTRAADLALAHSLKYTESVTLTNRVRKLEATQPGGLLDAPTPTDAD